MESMQGASIPSDLARKAASLQYGQPGITHAENGIMLQLVHSLHEKIDNQQKLIDMIDKAYEGIMRPMENTPQQPTEPNIKPGSSPLARQLGDAISRLEIQNIRLDVIISRSEV